MRWLAVPTSAFSALTSATSGTSRFCNALTDATLKSSSWSPEAFAYDPERVQLVSSRQLLRELDPRQPSSCSGALMRASSFDERHARRHACDVRVSSATDSWRRVAFSTFSSTSFSFPAIASSSLPVPAFAREARHLLGEDIERRASEPGGRQLHRSHAPCGSPMSLCSASVVAALTERVHLPDVLLGEILELRQLAGQPVKRQLLLGEIVGPARTAFRSACRAHDLCATYRRSCPSTSGRPCAPRHADAVLQHASVLERLNSLPSAERLMRRARLRATRPLTSSLRRFALRLLPGFAGGFEIRRGFLRQLRSADRVFDLAACFMPSFSFAIWTSIPRPFHSRDWRTTACSTACCWLSALWPAVRRGRQRREDARRSSALAHLQEPRSGRADSDVLAVASADVVSSRASRDVSRILP